MGVTVTAPLAGPTCSEPGGTAAVLVAVDGNDCSTYAGMVNVPELAGAMHSTYAPGVVEVGVSPDCSVELMARISTKPLGSPPTQVMVSGVDRDIGADDGREFTPTRRAVGKVRDIDAEQIHGNAPSERAPPAGD